MAAAPAAAAQQKIWPRRRHVFEFPPHCTYLSPSCLLSSPLLSSPLLSSPLLVTSSGHGPPGVIPLDTVRAPAQSCRRHSGGGPLRVTGPGIARPLYCAYPSPALRRWAPGGRCGATRRRPGPRAAGSGRRSHIVRAGGGGGPRWQASEIPPSLPTSLPPSLALNDRMTTQLNFKTRADAPLQKQSRLCAQGCTAHRPRHTGRRGSVTSRPGDSGLRRPGPRTMAWLSSYHLHE
jgi:hypothetical protein